jgi:hypothetical protein
MIANARAQLLTVPPYAVCAVVLCLTSYASDRLQSRGVCVSLSAALGGIGYLLLLVIPHNNHVRYFATFCITSGTYTVIGVVIAWCYVLLLPGYLCGLTFLRQFHITWDLRRKEPQVYPCTWLLASVVVCSERTSSLLQKDQDISRVLLFLVLSSSSHRCVRLY